MCQGEIYKMTVDGEVDVIKTLLLDAMAILFSCTVEYGTVAAGSSVVGACG